MQDRVIRVFDRKTGDVLATFEYEKVPNLDKQGDMLINPHVTIAEDMSVATFAMFKDSPLWARISGVDAVYEIDGRHYFIYGERAVQIDDKFVNVTLSEDWYRLDTKYVQAYNVEGALEYIGEYTVSLAPFSDKPLVVNGKPVSNNPFPRNNLGYYIWTLLQDTEYSLIECDVWDETYDAVQKISAFNLESE